MNKVLASKRRMDIKYNPRHWVWGLYTAVAVIDMALCAIGISTSSWMEVKLSPVPSGKYCTLLSPNRGTMSSGLITADLCFGTGECTDMMILVASLGYAYVFVKLIAVIMAAMSMKAGFNSSQIRVQAILQLSTFVISIIVVVLFGTYISNYMGLQYVDWSCSSWSFYVFCSGAALGLLSFVGLGIAHARSIYRDHPPAVKPPPTTPKDKPPSIPPKPSKQSPAAQQPPTNAPYGVKEHQHHLRKPPLPKSVY